MAQFSTTHQPAGKGRPKGSKNVRGKLTKEITEDTMDQLALAVKKGEPWALQEVLKRISPALKAITPVDSLDGEMLTMKIKEIQELEQRLIALEAHNNG
jgi:hypothetical protein